MFQKINNIFYEAIHITKSVLQVEIFLKLLLFNLFMQYGRWF